MRKVSFLPGVMLAALLAGCAPSRPPAVVAPEALAPGLDAFLAAHPRDPGAGVRIDRVARTDAASWHVVQAAQPEPPHRHLGHDLTVVLLRGTGVVHTDAGRTPMRAGDVVVVPRGRVHWFAPDGTSVGLVVYTPPLDAPDLQTVDVDTQAGGR